MKSQTAAGPVHAVDPEPQLRRTPRLRGLAEAVRFLFPPGYRAHVDDGAFCSAPAWFAPLGLIVGLAWAGVFRVTWKLYGEIGGEVVGIRVVPPLAVILLETLLTGPFLAMGLARTVHLLTGEHPLRAETDRGNPLSPVGTLTLFLVVLSEFVLIVSVPHILGWWFPHWDWRRHFNFLFPEPIYRPLILAPIWGRWGILLASVIGRPGHDADAATRALCAAMRPARLIRAAIVPMAATAIYCMRGQNFFLGLIIGLLVFGVTYLVAVAMAWRGGGQTRQSLFAAGQIAQLSFLAFYRAFWPHIHR